MQRLNCEKSAEKKFGESMASLVVVCVLSLLLCVPWFRWGSAEAGAGAEVLQLSDENFHSTVEAADLAVVVFHAPWSVVGAWLEAYGVTHPHLPSVQVPPLP